MESKSTAFRVNDRRLLCVLLFLIAALLNSCSSIPQLPESVESVSAFEKCMEDVVNSGTPPGMSLAVVRFDSMVYAAGFGWADEPGKIRATSETVYHWWSCTKIVTAIAILQLQEQGKLSLDDPVAEYLPFFKVKYPSDKSRTVTILNLLNHSSGLPDPSGLTLVGWIHHDDNPPVNQTMLVKRVLPDYSELEFEPGERSDYSNIGYMVLGAVIEKIEGISYEDYVRRNILQPLGMDHTDFVYVKGTENDEAAGAQPTFNLMTPLLPFVVGSYIREVDWGHLWMKRVYTDQTPSTGLIGPVTDAARLVAAYLNGGRLNGKRILSPGSIRLMTYDGQIATKNEDSLSYRRQGIGWQVYGRSGRWVITHEGGGPGFRTKIQLYPDEGLGLILFTNDATCEPWRIVNVAASLKWQSRRGENKPQGVAK